LYSDAEVCHIDMMDYVSKAFKKSIVDSYKLLIKTAPELWGFIYKQANKSKGMEGFSRLMKTINTINAKKFFDFVCEYEPDEIVCTHPLPASAITGVKKAEFVAIPVSMLITDYGFHSFWFLKGVKQYFVATEKMAWELKKRLPYEIPIHVTGIPVQPEFLVTQDKNKLRKDLNIPKNKKVILLMSGGQGLIKSDKIAEHLLGQTFDQPLHLIAIAGSNKRLFKKLEQLKKKKDFGKNSLEAVGWTDKIQKYMQVSEGIISKPGGLTTTECLAVGKPLIAIHPIPGQEEDNAEYVLEKGRGFIAHNLLDLEYYVGKCFEIGDFGVQEENPAEKIFKKL